MSRTILVSGGSRGIGASIVKSLTQAGHQIISLARSTPTPQQLLDDTVPDGLKATSKSRETYDPVYIPLDISDLEKSESTIKQLISEHSIDALICCAGYGRFGTIEQFSTQQIIDQMQTNLIAHMTMCRYLLPALKRSTRSDIIFIGSESALQGGRYGAVYSASKAGLRGFAQALRHECATANCHIGIINPGMTRSSFFEHLDFEPGTDPENAIDPVTVAQATLQMLDAPDNSVIDEINLSPLKKVVRKKQS